MPLFAPTTVYAILSQRSDLAVTKFQSTLNLHHLVTRMTLQWILATVHLLALGIGLGAIFARAQSLRSLEIENAARRVLLADGFWGGAMFLWISTGFLRAFGGFEKGTDYYIDNSMFWMKMSILGLILVLEIRPIIQFTKWRSSLRNGQEVDKSSAPQIATISYIQLVLTIMMVFSAAGMARGMGVEP